MKNRIACIRAAGLFLSPFTYSNAMAFVSCGKAVTVNVPANLDHVYPIDGHGSLLSYTKHHQPSPWGVVGFFAGKRKPVSFITYHVSSKK